jgi:quercetin dioxygenase-like cupin family protein
VRTKTKMLLGTAGAAVVGIALATPVLKLTSPVLGSGVHTQPLNINGVYNVGDGYFKISLTTNRPLSVVTTMGAYSVGGENGWHTHPGMVINTITQGSADWYNDQCELTHYTAGDSWMEGSAVHMVRNAGSTNLQLVTSFLVSEGAPTRIDQPPPPCAVAIGLN